MRMNLALAIAFLGVGSMLVYVGFADPPGGLVGLVSDTLTGKRKPGTTTAAKVLPPAGPTTPQQQYAAGVIGAPAGPTTPQQQYAAGR